MDVVGSVRFSIRTGGAQREVVAFAQILVRLMPGIHPNHLHQIARAKMVDGYGLAVGNNVEAVVFAILLKRYGNQFQLGTGLLLFLFVNCGDDWLEIDPVAVSGPQLRYAPTGLFVEKPSCHFHPGYDRGGRS